MVFYVSKNEKKGKQRMEKRSTVKHEAVRNIEKKILVIFYISKTK